MAQHRYAHRVTVPNAGDSMRVRMSFLRLKHWQRRPNQRLRKGLCAIILSFALLKPCFGFQHSGADNPSPQDTIPQSVPRPSSTPQNAPAQRAPLQGPTSQNATPQGATVQSADYKRPTLPDEWIFKFQQLAAALVALLGATAAIVAVWLSSRLTRENESRRDLNRRVELAGNLISMIEAEKTFTEKGYYPLGIFNTVIEVPGITPEEIAEWIDLEGPLYAGTTSELVQFWGEIYERSKGFPSPICDIVSFLLWATGRAAFVAASARRRGKDLSPTDLRYSAIRIHHLSTAVGLAASDLQTELLKYIESPRRYGKVRSRTTSLEKKTVFDWSFISGGRQVLRTEVEEALSRKYLDKAAKLAKESVKIDGQSLARVSESALPKDRSPKWFRLVLPATVIEEFEQAFSRFVLQEFARNEADVGRADFFERLLEIEKEDSKGKTQMAGENLDDSASGVAEPEM